MLGGATVQTRAATEAAETCVGKTATIADHTGKITGTEGNDVIIGADGDNEIDAQGGVDYVYGGGGDHEVVTMDGPVSALFAKGGKRGRTRPHLRQRRRSAVWRGRSGHLGRRGR